MLASSLQKNAQQIDRILKSIFKINKIPIKIGSINFNKILKEFSTGGGKKLRPFLVVCGYKMFGGRKHDILRVAAAIELIHSFLLIHDDIIDNDSVRRGKPTVHKQVEKFLSGCNKKEYGKSMALLVGDYSFSLALAEISNTNFSDNEKKVIIDYILKNINNTIFGQALDVDLAARKHGTRKQVLQVYKYKTAKYSFEMPLLVGAKFAGASSIDQKNLSEYALAAGISFQIIDDYIGLFGSEKETGKSNISDLQEGKRTLIIEKTLEVASVPQRRVVLGALGNKKLTRKQALEVKNIIRRCGTKQYSLDLAKTYTNSAILALDKIEEGNINKKYLKHLIELSEYNNSRRG